MDGTALLMRAIAEGGASAAAPMREAALAEGAVLLHLSLGLAAKVGPVYVCSVMCPLICDVLHLHKIGEGSTSPMVVLA